MALFSCSFDMMISSLFTAEIGLRRQRAPSFRAPRT
jgi:hypothetical protein